MKKALLLRLWLAIAIVLTVCLTSAVLLLSNEEKDSKEKEMTTMLNFISVIYNNEENHTPELADSISIMANKARVTFISESGEVIADTDKSGEDMNNHNNREEVIQAREKGIGVSTRFSETLHRNQMYAAIKTDNGDIVRISYTINGFWAFAGMFALPVFVSALISVLVGILVVRNTVRQIVKPLDTVTEAMRVMMKVDADNIQEFEEIPPHKYPEIDELIAIFNFMRESIIENIRTIESERKQEKFILDNLGDGVMLFDDDMQIISVNKAGLKLLESSDTGTGKTIPEIIRQPALIDTAVKSVKRGVEAAIDITVGGKIIMVQIYPVIESGKKSGCSLMVLRDITEKRMSEQLRQDFFANAGHELKTPLTAITGFAELLENGLVPQDKRDYYISKILAEANRMSTIISDILEISALENKTVVEEISDCSVMDICLAVCESLEPAAKSRNVTITCSGDDFKIKAAQKHIHELIENLVSNAVKYNRENGSVTIELCNVGQIGCIYVKDTGIGIPKESQSRVFERFYRVDKGRSTKEGSTGLGLSIVKHIVNCYGGTVTLVSELGKGTMFCVRLPIAK